jgi:hypothetical protein
MADGSNAVLTLEQPAVTELVTELRSFAGDHGGAKAVIEYTGRRGARIVLVGGDGAGTDRFVPGTDIARGVCAEAGVSVEKLWERELVKQMGPEVGERHPAGRRVLVRCECD